MSLDVECPKCGAEFDSRREHCPRCASGKGNAMTDNVVVPRGLIKSLLKADETENDYDYYRALQEFRAALEAKPVEPVAGLLRTSSNVIECFYKGALCPIDGNNFYKEFVDALPLGKTIPLYFTPPIPADQAARIAELEECVTELLGLSGMDKDRITELEAKLAASEAARKEAEKDAARYRWLKEFACYYKPEDIGSPYLVHRDSPQNGWRQHLDDAIDAALTQKDQGK